MSDATQAAGFRIPEGSLLANLWKGAAAVALLGAGVAVMGALSNPHRFAFSYLFGVALVMTMCLGTMLFVMLQHLTHAGWSVTVRRTAEFFAAGAIVIPLLVLPLIGLADTLYPWFGHHEEAGVAHAEEGDHEHEGAHGHAGGHAEHHTPEHALHARILDSKRWYLNQPFWYLRMAIILAVWLLLSLRLVGLSTRQDTSKDPQNTVKLQRFSTYGLILWAFTITLAGVDWIMSLEPNWYSTMFGVRVFASSAVISYALIILLSLGFKRWGVVDREINVEHYHDLGKLMFGFLVFWAYVSFSEFMLIWYASIPEETVYYHRRWDHETWKIISLTIVTMKFILPFYFIMSRNVKRNLGMLAFGAAWLLVVHLVEMFYWIMPYVADQPAAAPPFEGLWIDVACVCACVGLYLAVVFRRMLGHNVIPVGDPRLPRALAHVNH